MEEADRAIVGCAACAIVLGLTLRSYVSPIHGVSYHIK